MAHDMVAVLVRRDEAETLNVEGLRCGACGHLDSLHNYHCCDFCTVVGCECEWGRVPCATHDWQWQPERTVDPRFQIATTAKPVVNLTPGEMVVLPGYWECAACGSTRKTLPDDELSDAGQASSPIDAFEDEGARLKALFPNIDWHPHHFGTPSTAWWCDGSLCPDDD